MKTLGNCGELPNQNKLPVLVGEPVTRCPVAAAMEDDDIELLESLVAGPHGPGNLAGVPRVSMSPFYRDACELADWWKAEWLKKGGPNAGH